MPPPKLLLSLFLLSFLTSSIAWEWPANSTEPIDYCYPDQVHISLGDAYYNSQYGFNASVNEPNSTLMIVWQTQANCDIFYVMIKSKEDSSFVLNVTAKDIWIEFLNETISVDMNKNGQNGSYATYSHTAMISNLIPGKSYNYEIFQTNGPTSAGPFTFTLPAISAKDQDGPISFVVYGDVDTAGNNITYDALKSLQDKNPNALAFQMFLGDLGYEIFSDNGLRGEYCYNGWQALHSSWPFMVTPGNHERYKNFTFLNFRTRMPLYNKTKNHYYSFNVGKMHIIALNYYLYDQETDFIREQMFEWMEADLAAANATRNERPWIIITTHQPIYCSLNDPDDQPRKRCFNFYERYSRFDEIYYKYRVDLVLQGHAHIWERTTPLYQNKTQNYETYSEGQKKNFIINPKAPVYTLESATGNSYYMGRSGEYENYTVNINETLGYTIVTVVNGSSIRYEHFASKTGELLDYFYLNKGDEYKAFNLVPIVLNPAEIIENPNDPDKSDTGEDTDDDNTEDDPEKNDGDNETGKVEKIEGKTNSVYWIIFGGFISIGLITGICLFRRSKQKEYARFPKDIGANVIHQLHGGGSSAGEIVVDMQNEAI